MKITTSLRIGKRFFAGTCIAAFLLLPVLLGAQTLTWSDDFDRTELGPDWNSINGNWRITGGVLGGETGSGSLPPNPQNDVGLVEFVPGSYDLTEPFLFEGRFSPQFNLNSGFAGPAFQIQDQNNFLALRFREPNNRVQFYRLIDGSEGAVFSEDLPFDVITGEFYDVTVEMTALGDYSFSISDGVDTWTRTASFGTLTGGTVGAYGRLDDFMVDNVALTAVPEPSTYGLLAGLLAGGLLLVRRCPKRENI